MGNLIDLINPPENIRAWIYRVVLLVAVIVVCVALLFGQDVQTIVTGAAALAAAITSALAVVNTSTDKT